MSKYTGECFIVLKPFSESENVIFGRNTITCQSESSGVQEIVYTPAADNSDKVKCTHIEIDPVPTLATIISKPKGIWGADSGSNEKGVCIALTWTENEPADGILLGVDYTRLGLERSSTAEEAVDIITELSALYGAHGESRESAKICFIICDRDDVWLLNIVGDLWAAEKVASAFKSIPIGLSVTTKVDKSSPEISQKAEQLQLWAGDGDFNFSRIFSSSPAEEISWPNAEPGVEGGFCVTDMFAVLRERALQRDGESKTSHVSTLAPNGISCHWFTATPNPNESVFKPFIFTPNVRISSITKYLEDAETTTTLNKFHAKRKWGLVGELLKSLERSCVEEVQSYLAENTEPNSELDELMKDCVEAEVKFYR